MSKRGAGAYQFGRDSDTSTYRYLESTNLVSTKDTRSFSFSAWIYPQGAGGLVNPGTLMQIGSEGTAKPEYTLQLKNNGGLMSTFFDGYSDVQDTTQIPSLSADTRYYITITYDATSQYLSYYLDGVLLTQNRISNPIPGVHDHLILGTKKGNTE